MGNKSNALSIIIIIIINNGDGHVMCKLLY